MQLEVTKISVKNIQGGEMMESQCWTIELTKEQVEKISDLIGIEICDNDDLEYAIKIMLEQL